MSILKKLKYFTLVSYIIINCIVLLPNFINAETMYSGKIIDRDGTLIKLSTGVVVDTKLNVMWAQSDNGKKVSIEEARKYVSSFKLAGYDDWRFPDIRELETLLIHDSPNSTTPGEGCSGNYMIHHFFKLTCCCPWALQDNGTRPASYPFMKKISGGSMWHHKSNTLGNRIIPVRDLKK